MPTIHNVFNLLRCFARFKLGRPTPFYMTYEVTYRCNLRCKFCSVWRNGSKKELDFGQARRLIDKVAEVGVPVFNLSGGEPLLREDLEDLALYAQRRGMMTQLNTNGTLISRDRARKIAEVFDVVNVSLDGFEKTHDGIRGINGAFKKAVQGMKNLIKVKDTCTVGVASVLVKENFAELIPFFHEVKRWGGDFVCVLPVGGTEFFSNYSVSAKEITDFTEKLLAEKMKDHSFISPWENIIKLMPKFVRGEMPRICDAGKLYLALDSEGQISICPIFSRNDSYKIGSLLDSSLFEILHSKRAEQVFKLTKNCSCYALCTTAFSLMFRMSLPNLAMETFSYYKLFT